MLRTYRRTTRIGRMERTGSSLRVVVKPSSRSRRKTTHALRLKKATEGVRRRWKAREGNGSFSHLRLRKRMVGSTTTMKESM